MSTSSKVKKGHPGDCKALWVGSFGRLYDGTLLATGETEHVMSQPEAEGSDNWQVLESLKAGDS